MGPSPYSLLKPEDIEMLGRAALAKGIVSPQAAKQNASMLGMGGGAPWQNFNPATDAPKDDGEDLPLSGMQVPNPGQADPNRRGSMIDSKLTGTDKSGTKSVQATYLQPQQYGDLLSMQQGNPIFQHQEKGVGDFEDLKNAIAMGGMQGTGGVLRPLAAYADSLKPGSKMIEGMPPPTDPMARAKLLITASDDQLKRQQDLSRDQLMFMQRAKLGTDQQTTEQGLIQLLQNQQKNPGINLAQAIPRFMSQTQKEAQKFQEEDQLLEKARGAVNSNNPVAQANVGAMIASMFEGKRAAYAMIQGEGLGDPSFWARFDQEALRIKNGSLTPANKQEYNAFLAQLQKANDMVKKVTRDRWLVSGRGMGMDDDTINGIASPQWTSPYNPAAVQASPPAGPAPAAKAAPSGAAAAPAQDSMAQALQLEAQRRARAKGGK